MGIEIFGEYPVDKESNELIRASGCDIEVTLRYNWQGWFELKAFLALCGLDTSELVDFNDGDRISAATCLAIAHLIDSRWKHMTKRDQRWLKGHSDKWRMFAALSGGHQY